MLVDSHCHLDCLDLTEYQQDLTAALAAAQDHDVSHFLCVSIDLTHFPRVLSIAEQYSNVFASVGLHPNVTDEVEPNTQQLIELAQHDKIVAIGETGLDYYRSNGELTWQQDRFRRHIQVARHVQKPLIIHSRQAPTDTVNIMQQEQADHIGGVMHCFTENWDMAKRCLDLGFYISISGIVTFRNAQELVDVVRKVPLDRLLIETDSPYLAPVPFRGKPNEPQYVKYVAEKVAEIKQVSYEEVAQATTKNFFKLFALAVQ
ncbi:MAG: YchF/TatD family DNA exonuclease [Legionellales bacterium]|nr:YchF/TatD family DNA exonuclease [Legionellales bacterium]